MTIALSAPGQALGEVSQVALFINTWFCPTDPIMVRPIESKYADENGADVRGRPVKGETRYRLPHHVTNPALFSLLLDTGARHKADLFFGVCPRVKQESGHDLEWQIRQVNGVFADLDHCTPDQAYARIAAAGLPPPTIVISSGYGCHCYWLFTTPYLIDDAGPDVRVSTDHDLTGGPKYFVSPETGERVYKDGFPGLSPKALHVKSVIEGVAKAIGGDDTSDLYRVLRLPATLNRKYERNGVTPVPCELVECDPSRRYPLEVFLPFAAPVAPRHSRVVPTSNDPTVRREQFASPTDAPTDRELEWLNERLHECATAPDRSKADYSLCCFAIEHGMNRDDVWRAASDVGKFALRGRDYFDATWEAAAADVGGAAGSKRYVKPVRTPEEEEWYIPVPIRCMGYVIFPDNSFAKLPPPAEPTPAQPAGSDGATSDGTPLVPFTPLDIHYPPSRPGALSDFTPETMNRLADEIARDREARAAARAVLIEEAATSGVYVAGGSPTHYDFCPTPNVRAAQNLAKGLARVNHFRCRSLICPSCRAIKQDHYKASVLHHMSKLPSDATVSVFTINGLWAWKNLYENQIRGQGKFVKLQIDASNSWLVITTAVVAGPNFSVETLTPKEAAARFCAAVDWLPLLHHSPYHGTHKQRGEHGDPGWGLIMEKRQQMEGWENQEAITLSWPQIRETLNRHGIEPRVGRSNERFWDRRFQEFAYPGQDKWRHIRAELIRGEVLSPEDVDVVMHRRERIEDTVEKPAVVGHFPQCSGGFVADLSG